jgi:hypothetical protein
MVRTPKGSLPGVRASIVIAFFAAALCGLALPGAAAAQRLTFTKLVQGSSRLPIFGGRVTFATSAVVLDPLAGTFRPQDLSLEVDKPAVKALTDVNWKRRFVLGVLTSWPTRGFKVSIQRVSLQNIGGAQQLCVIAARQPPPEGRVVLQEPTTSYSFVAVDRVTPGTPTTTTVVVRGPHGKLLFVTTSNGVFDTNGHRARRDVCRP